MKDTINHSGIIERIEGDTIFVKIVQESACAGCHAKSMCMAADSKEKIIEVTDHSGSFQVNEPVIIQGQTSLGLQAVFLAFVLPLALIVFIIVFGTYQQWNESTSALSALVLLGVYYIILYLFRDKLKKKFVFTLNKTKN